MRRFDLALVLLFVALLPLSTWAGGTTVHEIVGRDALAAGELETLTLDAHGVLRPGPSFGAIELGADSAWAALSVGDTTVVGTGDGEVLLVGADEAVRRVDMGPSALLVSALATGSEGGVWAAVFPGARLHTVAPDGTAKVMATLPAEYVWALAADDRGGVVAATGVPGALFHVDAFGAVEKLADLEDDHARCLTRAGDAWLVGTAPRGLVVRVARDGTRRVLRDLEMQEVVGIVPLEAGGWLVAANADTAGGNAQVLGGLLGAFTTPAATPPGKAPTERPTLQQGHVLWLEPGGATSEVWTNKEVAALGLTRDGNGAVLGTYPSARLIRVAPNEPATLLADLPEAEASVVVSASGRLDYAVTSNPAVLHRRTQGAALAGTWTSAPLDAEASARWGRVRCLGQGIEGLSWRAGETQEPDATWTDWRGAEAFDGSAGTAPAEARYLQARVRLAGEGALLRGLAAVAAAPNRAPSITELKIAVEKSAPKGAGPAAAHAFRGITWEASDPDGDGLAVTLHARRLGSSHWIELLEKATPAKPKHVWNTTGLPDGSYVIRLVVSDAPGNAMARTAERRTPPFRVDNTAPVVKVSARVAAERLWIQGEAVDQAGGRVVRLRVAVDGGPWQVVEPVDGIFDEPAEPFEAALALPGAGPHDVVVQAYDAEGNVGAAAATVTVR